MCISHDAACGAWLGRPVFAGKHLVTPEQIRKAMPNSRPTHIFEAIVPALRSQGLSESDIDTLLIDNPQRYFECADPPERCPR